MYDEGLYQWSDEIEKQSKVAEVSEGDFIEVLKLTQTLIFGISWFDIEKEQDRFYEILEKWKKVLNNS